jgi:hypothetical protein
MLVFNDFESISTTEFKKKICNNFFVFENSWV